MEQYIIRESTKRELNAIVYRLVEYNLSKVPSKQEKDFISINRVIEDNDGQLLAGIQSKMYCWNCLYIDTLWVDANYRNKGFGTRLLREVEKVAKDMNCEMAHLDTFDFQAKEFYLKNGYEIFGVLDECPKDHKRYYLKKKL